ncbi:transcriptional regulator, partial [Enterococcus faecalis]
SKDGSDPATDFQLYLEQTLGFTFSNQYNPNRIGEYLAACEYRKPQKSSPLHEIAKQVLTSYQDLQQVRMDTSNLIDKIADNIGQIKQRNHYRMSVFHPLLNDLQLNFGKEFIALRFCFLAIEKRVGYVSDDELCFLLVTILNTPQRYKPQLTARLASNGSSEYRQFIKRELQRNLSDVQVFLNEEVSIADWQFIFSKNKQLKKLADDNIKFDVFNKSHLAIVKNETALYKRFKVERGCSIPSIFETISMSNKLSKAKVVEKITERLIEEEVTDFATIEDAFNRDQHQPLIWRKMECAILFMIDPRQLQSQIREFSWSALINWCENNQNNQVRKVVIIVAGKIEEIDFYEIFRRFVSNG